MSLKAKLCISALVKTVQTLPAIQLLQLQRSILGREALTKIIEAKVEVVVAQAQSQLVTPSS
jgi:hypothetical protein